MASFLGSRPDERRTGNGDEGLQQTPRDACPAGSGQHHLSPLARYRLVGKNKELSLGKPEVFQLPDPSRRS